MAQNWDYAELSKAAKAAGSPEKYVKKLYASGRHAGKMEMLPWVGIAAAAVVGHLYTPVKNKIVDFYKTKIKKNNQEIETCKQEIISGIKEYDTMQEDKKEGGNVDE